MIVESNATHRIFGGKVDALSKIDILDQNLKDALSEIDILDQNLKDVLSKIDILGDRGFEGGDRKSVV